MDDLLNGINEFLVGHLARHKLKASVGVIPPVFGQAGFGFARFKCGPLFKVTGYRFRQRPYEVSMALRGTLLYVEVDSMLLGEPETCEYDLTDPNSLDELDKFMVRLKTGADLDQRLLRRLHEEALVTETTR